MRQRLSAEGAEGPQGTLAMKENEIGQMIIGAAVKVHSVVGPGLLESAYEACLMHVDFVVQDLVVVELKAIAEILPLHRGQLLSYLRLGGFKLRYLLNSNIEHMRDGIIRMVNGL